MASLQRGFLVAALACGITAATLAVHIDSHASLAARAAVDDAQCKPNFLLDHGTLPSPPTVTPATIPDHTVRMNVWKGPAPRSSSDPQSYCYRLANDTGRYVDAPTIVVRQGETFRWILADKIPAPSGPVPSPMATTPDGCALLDDDPPMPDPNATPGYLGRERVYATAPPMLANDTNLHTHGWHVDPDVDNVFKSLAMTPGQTCSYTFRIPLSQPAGTYWYHAHMHGLAGAQVGGGLSGTLIVLPATPQPSPLPERVMLIKNSVYDLSTSLANRVLQFNKAVAQGNPGASSEPSPPPTFDPYNPPSWPSGWPITSQNNCPTPGSAFMSHWMLNGYPIADPQVHVPTPRTGQIPGSRMLYRIIDATSDSFANIKLLNAQGVPQKMDVVGRDGVPVDPSGNYEGLAATFENVLLPPGGRVDIVVTGASAPQTIIADRVCTGYLGEAIPRRSLVSIVPVLGKQTVAAHARVIPLAKAGMTAADRFYAQRNTLITGRRALTFTQYNNAQGQMAWYVTETSSGNQFVEKPFWLASPAPGDHDYLPTIRVKQGSVEEWDLIDATAEVHAFHIHQLTFVTTSNPFEGPHLHVFQDTVPLMAAQTDPSMPANGDYPFLKPTITKIIIDFRNVHKGTFVYHCHMLFHEDRGMMGIIQVY